MLRKLRSGSVLILVFLTYCAATSQLSGAEREAVLQMFDHPEEVQWVRSYKGHCDAFHPVRIVLGTDGMLYRGWWTLESGMMFDLSGRARTEYPYHALLEEIDQNGLVCGTLSMRIDQDKISGEWNSVDHTRVAEVYAVGSDLVEVRKFEPRFVHLAGSVGAFPLSVFLAQEAINVQGGSGIFEKELVEVHGTCKRHCDTILMGVFGVDMTGLLALSRSSRDRYDLTFTDVDDRRYHGSAAVVRQCPAKSLAWSGYQEKAEAVYPVTSHTAVDDWFDQVFQTWAAATREATLQLVEKPQNRWSAVSAAWVDLTHWTDDMISGIITMFEPGSSAFRRESFTLEPQTGVPLALDRYLKRDADLMRDLNALVREFCPMLFEMGDRDYMAWARDVSFSHISLSGSGLIVSSEFDPQFGDIKALIPYERLVDYLRVKPLLRQL